jgi:hypothetical protein
MVQRALSPSLVGREAELFGLEDALLAARRGEGLEATREELELKGFDSRQPAWRVRAGTASRTE